MYIIDYIKGHFVKYRLEEFGIIKSVMFDRYFLTIYNEKHFILTNTRNGRTDYVGNNEDILIKIIQKIAEVDIVC